MAYRFQVNEQTCINCGICMDLCPVRCLDMTRPSTEGELASETVIHFVNRASDYAYAMARFVDVDDPALFEGRRKA